MLREEIRSRIYFALSRFSPRLNEVTVKIGDVGTENSSQQLCRLSRNESIVVERMPVLRESDFGILSLACRIRDRTTLTG